MSKKIFLVDVARCNGCHNCQIACKDEHCGTSWLPYAAEQPDTGQFWCQVKQEVHGSVPKVNMTYLPLIGAQTEAIREYAPEVLMDRGDGLVVIDPEKAKGREDIAEKFEGVYWNAELNIPQGCTGCAHLLDDGWTVPRCVDFCSTGALQFGEAEDFDLSDAVPSKPGSHLYYRNLPGRRICGTVADRSINEVIIGAKVTISDAATGEAVVIETDELGDFIYKNAAEGEFDVLIEAPGYVPCEYHVSTADDDAVIGEVLVER